MRRPTRLSRRVRSSPFGREDLRRVILTRLGAEPPGGFFLTTSTSQQAWSSFNILFPALITLEKTENQTLNIQRSEDSEGLFDMDETIKVHLLFTDIFKINY